MTTETTETQEMNEAVETTEAQAAPQDRVLASATALIEAVKARVFEWVRVGIDLTAKSVETGSEHLNTLAERLHAYANTVSEKATNAEG